ncbi:MAG: hypothetical protein OEZ00_09145, partial [Dehalococcoidia bacterium]|nr:hypothetical protein [Dehalococcoidia bacterium]
IDDTTGVDEIEIRSYYTLADIAGLNEATLKLSWWDGTAWVQCSPSGATYPIVDPIYRGYIWAIIRAAGAIPGSIPTLDDLKGAPFMSMGMPPAAPAGGGGGGAPPPPPPGITSLSGFVGGGGRFYFSVIASSEDDVCTLTIDSGTIGLTKDGKPLREISIMVTDEPPTPPEGAYIIGLAYDFSPDGATFEPPASLTFTYDPSLIPKGIDEENLVIALWDADAGNWVVLDDCIVDPVANTITAPISHFTTFAVLGFEPAVFKCSALTIAPDEVAIGESVNISVLVSNTGATSSGYELILKIDGVAEATKQIVLDAGASREVSFTISKDASGVYQVNIDGLGGSFVVKGKPTPAPAPPPTPPAPQAKPAVNWPVLGGIIAAVVLVGLLIFFLVRRRAY